MNNTVFIINVVGVTYSNNDGSSRQNYISKMKLNDNIIIEKEPDNPYDSNAIKVLYGDGLQIGYLPMNKSELITSYINMGYKVSVSLVSINGGTDGYNYGCTIELKIK